MKFGIVVFPGSNCDRDVQTAIELVTGFAPKMVWHGDATLPASRPAVIYFSGLSSGKM